MVVFPIQTPYAEVNNYKPRLIMLPKNKTKQNKTLSIRVYQYMYTKQLLNKVTI